MDKLANVLHGVVLISVVSVAAVAITTGLVVYMPLVLAQELKKEWSKK